MKSCPKCNLVTLPTIYVSTSRNLLEIFLRVARTFFSSRLIRCQLVHFLFLSILLTPSDASTFSVSLSICIVSCMCYFSFYVLHVSISFFHSIFNIYFVPMRVYLCSFVHMITLSRYLISLFFFPMLYRYLNPLRGSSSATWVHLSMHFSI